MGTATSEDGHWVLQGKDVCFDAYGRNPKDTFKTNVTGLLGGVRFVYKAGGVRCAASVPMSHWGCARVVYGHLNPLCTFLTMGDAETVLYPTVHSKQIDMLHSAPPAASVPAGASPAWYRYKAGDLWSPDIQFTEPIYTVSAGEQFTVQYGEYMIRSNWADNYGTTCTDVYFWMLHHAPSPTQTYWGSGFCHETLEWRSCAAACDSLPVCVRGNEAGAHLANETRLDQLKPLANACAHTFAACAAVCVVTIAVTTVCVLWKLVYVPGIGTWKPLLEADGA